MKTWDMRTSKGKIQNRSLAKLRKLLKYIGRNRARYARHIGRHRGKYGLLTGFALGGASGLKKGLGLANYSPGDKKTFRDIKAEQKALRRLLQKQQKR